MHFPDFESADGADATSPAIDHQPTAEFAQVDRAATATTPISIDFDANRLALLKRAKFQGPSYQKFTDELWLYARAVLLSKLRSGLIFAWCAEGGVAVSPTSAERDVLHRSPEDRDHLVIDTIAHAIPKFSASRCSARSMPDPTYWSRRVRTAIPLVCERMCRVVITAPGRDGWSK